NQQAQAEALLRQEKERLKADAEKQREDLRQNPNLFVTQEGYLAGATYAAFLKSQQYLAQNDRAALEQLVSTGLAGPVKAGIYVYVIDTIKERVPVIGTMATTTVKIRPKGEMAEFWTNVEAVKR